MAKKVFKDGKWSDGAASPKLLREDLRRLPSDLYTEESEDPDKVHQEDAEHVQSQIIHEYFERAQDEMDGPPAPDGEEELKLSRVARDAKGQDAKITQEQVDIIRMAAILNRLRWTIFAKAMGEPVHDGHQYLWFDKDDINHYEIRPGNPPARSRRPKHLKNIDLVVDVHKPPQRIKDMLEARGVTLWKTVKDVERSAEKAAELQKMEEEEKRIITLN